MKGVAKYIKLFHMYKPIYLGDSENDKKLSDNPFCITANAMQKIINSFGVV